MKYFGHRKLKCELSKLSKLNAFILLEYYRNTDASILVYKHRPERTGFNMYAENTHQQLTFLALLPWFKVYLSESGFPSLTLSPQCMYLVTWYRWRHVNRYIPCHWWKFWSRDLRYQLYLVKWKINLNSNYKKSVPMLFRFLWVIVIFRFAAYLRNVIC